jgi:cell division transport system permease protein
MTAWFAQQRAALGLTLGRMASTPFATLLTVLVIGVALALPASLYIALDNLASLAVRLSGTPEITLFLADKTTPERVREIDTALRKRGDLKSARFISRDQALKDLGARSGADDVVATLGKNPLPDAFVLAPKDTEPATLEQIRSETAKMSGVASAKLDSAWAQRLSALLALGRDFIALLAALLGTALVAVSFNTIRLQVMAQRDEIEVSRLLGATDAFVRRPFLYLGALQGMFGALIAVGILALALLFLRLRVDAAAQAYGSTFHLSGLAWADAGLVIALSGALGWMGAWLAATQHLRRL